MFNLLTSSARPKDTVAFTARQRRIHNFLRANPVGVLSSVDPNGDPHSVVIYFSIDNQFQVFFLTKSDTQKYDNLLRHDHVMLTVFDAESQATAQIAGIAVEITDNYEVSSVAGAVLAASLMTSREGQPPISKLQAGAYVAFRIEPNQIRMAVYSRPDSGSYDELFDTIESFELKDF